MENSSRTLLGRLFSYTTTASNPPPPVNFPVRRSVCSAWMRAIPPDAWTYFAMRLSTLCAGSDTATSIIAQSDDRMFRTVLLQLLDGSAGPITYRVGRTRQDPESAAPPSA